MDRPVDTPFLVLERQDGSAWKPVSTDLGVRWVWEEADGSYTLTTQVFTIAPSSGLRVLGAEVVRGSVVFRAQNPAPDADRSVTWRPVAPSGGTLRFVTGGRTPGPFGEGTWPP